jgi:regulator of replication initiation timing
MNINKNTEMDKKEETAKSVGEKLDGFLAELKGLVATKTQLASAELQDGGSVYTEGEWEDGVNVYTDEALQTPAADGEYVLADGRVMAVSDGKVAGLREAVEEDLMKKKEYMEKVEQLAKYLVDFKEELNSVKEELSSYREKLTALEAEKEEVKKETSEVKAELSKVKETPVGKSAQKLSEVAQREGRFNNALRGERFKMNH